MKVTQIVSAIYQVIQDTGNPPSRGTLDRSNYAEMIKDVPFRYMKQVDADKMLVSIDDIHPREIFIAGVSIKEVESPIGLALHFHETLPL